MSANTDTLPFAIALFYDRLLLEMEKPFLVHTNYGQVRNIPVGNTATIKFRKYGALSTNVTPLEELVTPVGTSPSVVDITATALWYGDYIIYSDVVTIESPDPVLTDLTMVLGDQAGRSIDEICRDIIVAGTNVLYADATSPKVNDERTDITSSDVLDDDILDLARSTLRSANAKFMTGFVNPDNGYDTSTVLPCFIGIIHPNTLPSLMAITNFVPVDKYQNQSGGAMPNEVGKYGNIRFVESTQAKVWEDAGDGGTVDVYATLIIGKDAYGVTSIKGHAMETIVKAIGSSGVVDALNQRGSIGWKANFVARILQQSWMLRIEHAV